MQICFRFRTSLSSNNIPLFTQHRTDTNQPNWNECKIYIPNPKTKFLNEKMNRKHKDFRQGQEIIPDITIFSENLKADFRRRNNKNTLKETIYSLEIKASERENSRLQFNEIKKDILKLKAQYLETKYKHNKEIGTGIMIIDTAPKENERMNKMTLDRVKIIAKENNVDIWYCCH